MNFSHRGYFASLLVLVLMVVGCQKVTSTPVQKTETPIPIPPSPTTTEDSSGGLAEKQVVTPTIQVISDREVEGWAVLVAKEDYSDVGDTDLITGFLNQYQMHALLVYFGWQEDHILELRDTFGKAEIRDSLDWLESSADDNDVVLFYIQGHSSYLREGLDWGTNFPGEWGQISSKRRVLVVEACEAEEFTEVTASDPNPQVSIASSAADELTWSGLWKEGMPIIGGVFSHYFLTAFTDPAADFDSDGYVSVQEAAISAEKQQRTYMHDVIFTVPELLEQYTANNVFPEGVRDYPHVIVNDRAGEPLFLSLEAYGGD